MTPEEKLKSLGLTLPPVRTPPANFVPFKLDGKTIYLSGQGPTKPDGSYLLAVAKAAAGDLARVETLKLLGMVNAMPDFGDSPKVINGCSDLLFEVLGERGRHARSAVGMGTLPNGMSVEIEAVMRIVD